MIMRWTPKLSRSEWVLLVIASLLLFWDLGRDELGSADEAIHAQVSREMARDGHWLYPTYRGVPYLEKPPLKLWLTAATFLLLGDSEWTARLWSALFSLGTIGVIFRLGRSLANEGVGFWSAIVLMTTHEFLFNHCSRTGELDSALLFFFAATVFAFWKLRVTSNPVYLYAAAFSLACGFLTKGHIALVPLLWLPIAWIQGGSVSFENKVIPLKCLINGILLFCFVALPWFILQLLHYGWEYGNYVFRHHLMGYLAGNVENADASIWYLVERWLQHDYPWPPFALIGLWILWRDSKETFRAHPARVWLTLWILTFTAILFLSKTKLPWYHLPLLLPLSLLAGTALDRFWKKGISKAYLAAWAALHVGLFFFTAGFFGCARDFFKAWMFNNQEVQRDYLWYFVNDPQQLSFRMAIVVLGGTVLAAFVSWIISSSSRAKSRDLSGKIIAQRDSSTSLGMTSTFPRAIIVISGISAVAFMIFEIKHVQVQEMAREKAFALKVQSPHALDIHVFDQFQEKAPHFMVSPALYYYLNAFPDWKIHHHQPTLVMWNEFQQAAQKPYAAVVPRDWILTSPAYLMLGSVRDTELILSKP
jgi:4-amino-4-deoxy-L-arabinose transferase-like glycosyltransferase